MKRKFKRFLRTLGDYWQPVFLSVLALVAGVVLYLYKLGSLTRGVDAVELDLHNRIAAESITVVDILRSSDNLLFNIGAYLLQFTPFRGAGSLRLMSVAFALAAIIAFYYIVRHWFTGRLALLATVLFATSASLLHVGRYADPGSGYLLLICAIGVWLWLQNHLNQRFAIALAAVVVASAVYVPGLALIIVPLVVWQFKTTRQYVKRLPLAVASAVGLFATLLLLPFCLTLLWPPEGQSFAVTLQRFIGVDGFSFDQLFTNMLHLPAQLFVSYDFMPQLGMVGPPLIDVFAGIMFLIGLIVSIRDWRLERSKLLLYLLLAGWLYIGFAGLSAVALILPVVYLFAAIGLGFMLSEWFSVFPRNPLAKWTGVGLIAVSITLVTAYNLRSYFVAWPLTPEARNAYSNRIR